MNIVLVVKKKKKKKQKKTTKNVTGTLTGLNQNRRERFTLYPDAINAD